MKNKNSWIYLLLFFSVLIFYGNSLWNDYAVNDDSIINNKYIQSGFTGIPHLFSNEYRTAKGENLSDNSSLVLVSFAIEHQFFGQHPAVSHCIHLLLYALCLVLLYQLLTGVLQLHLEHEWLPLIITLFFAAHPLHTEVVNSMSNRGELLCFVFGMLFLLYACKYFSDDNQKSRWAYLSILFLVFSLASKPFGFIYIPILLLILLFRKILPYNRSSVLFFSATSLIVITFFLFKSSSAKQQVYSFENSLIGINDISILVPTAFKILFYHLRMLIAPYPLRYYYGYNLFPLDNAMEPVVILSIIIHLLILIAGIIRFTKRDVLGLLMLVYLTSILPYSNLFFKYPGMFSEHALFLSGVWFISAVIIILYRWLKTWNSHIANRVAVTLAVALFVLYSIITIQRNLYWKDTLTLMSHDIENLEDSVLGNYLYANELSKEAYASKDDSTSIMYYATLAAQHYQRTIDLYPFYPDFFLKLGRLNRYVLKNNEKAEKLFKSLLFIDSTYADASMELGKLYFDNKNFRSSYPLLKKSYEFNPKDSMVLFYYGQNALAVGDLKTCYEINRQFMNLYPQSRYPYLNMGIYYSTILKDDSAVIFLEKAISLGDRNPEILKNMVIYYDKKKDLSKKEKYEQLLQKVLK